MGLPAGNLYASVYEKDEEAYSIWREFLSADKIVKLGRDSNFWEMGTTGPCGPCSEIIMDMGRDIGCGRPECSPGCDCDRWLEIWNLVFTQFNRAEDGRLTPLPQKNIDTGMGLERLLTACEGVKSAFQTDLFLPLIRRCQDMAQVEYGQDEVADKALRVIADHTRAVTFLIGDGCLPSNEGRGYVLRRVLRRALRQGRIIGISDPFLYKFTGEVIELMKEAYPPLLKRRQSIAEIVSCLLYTSPSPRDLSTSRMPSSA